MAIRSHGTSEHNAVAVSTRNVLRFFGGALGIAIFSVVLEERLKWTMPWRLEWVSDSAFSRTPQGELSPPDRVLVQHSYAGAISWVAEPKGMQPSTHVSSAEAGSVIDLQTTSGEARKEGLSSREHERQASAE
ncbi:hypothetical protein PRZ48_002554 [Zasmidium cellare]|uniref:Uncharacterized protein n=1 Tax=Zasmidium cellare TaxID=395010 RepID=A0ABR0F6Q3_ZASCE|nr:hypothetical protein PRZ48_002554 [Zasmidium cellare]